MYICFACSNAYAMYAGIAMNSFLDCNRELDIPEIFILDFGLSEENRRIFADEAQSFGRKISFVDAGTIMSGKAEMCGIKSFRGSLATYARAFIEFLVPEYVDRLFFIDSDTVTVGSVSELQSFPMDGKAIAGMVVSSWYGRNPPVPEFKLAGKEYLYINCGIVLYNMPEWRRSGCSEKLIKYFRDGNVPLFAEQSAINISVPSELIGYFPPKFNYAGHIFPKGREVHELVHEGWYSKEQFEEAIKAPVIIHYPGLSPKPWYNETVTRRQKEYLEAKAKTAWKDVPQESLKEYIRKTKPSAKARLRFWMSYYKSKLPCVWMVKLVGALRKNDFYR